MIRLAVDEGLRRAEIARVRVDDCVQVVGDWFLVVHGKGGKDRTVPLMADLATEIMLHPPGWLFPSALGESGHMTAGHVGKLIAQELSGQWAAHSLRHRFATDLYAATRDIVVVQRFLGHSRPETTQGYVQVPEDALRDGLHALFRSRGMH